ncbi:MAG: hypothetical protein AAGB23_01085 [Pseudomonadota bacterium]
MVRRIHWFYIGWTLYMGATLIKFPPWEHGWHNVFIGLGVYLPIALIGHGSDVIGRRYNIGEARFDSETGKPLPPYEDGQ